MKLGASLAGKTATVMGGGGGMGLASVKALLIEGANVLIGDVDAEKGQAAESELKPEYGGKVLFQKVNVAQTEEINDAIRMAADTWGGLDILVNVVGINIAKPIEQTTDEDFAKVLNTDMRSAFAAIRAAVPHMKRRGGGSIVSIGSVHGEQGYGDHQLYTMAKAGLNGMTRELAFTLGPDRIRVNVVAPGYITPTSPPEKIAKTLKPEALETFWRDWAPSYPVYDAFTQPLRRSCHAEDVANVVHFLASDLSQCITGEVLHVDGGLSLSMFRFSGRSDYVKAAKEAEARWKEWYQANKATVGQGS